jgi:hypothetical protein
MRATGCIRQEHDASHHTAGEAMRQASLEARAPPTRAI